MRISTDDDKAYRRDAIERASRFYDSNKATAVVSACEDVRQPVRAAEAVLDRDDLTMQQKQEIAEGPSTKHPFIQLSSELLDTVRRQATAVSWIKWGEVRDSDRMVGK